MRTANLGMLAAVAVVAFIGFTGGCSERDDEDGATVLARVDGTSITDEHVQLALQTTLKGASGAPVSEAARRKMLDSLVSSRAIATRAQRELGRQELAEVEAKVAAHRLQLLAQKYLAAQGQPPAVTDAMIAAYYQEHPEDFGGGDIRSYQLLQSQQRLPRQQRASLIEKLGAAKSEADWAQWARRLREAGLPVDYDQGQVPEAALEPKLLQALLGLSPGEVSGVVLFSDRIGVIRLVSLQARTASPLSQVKDTIRAMLERRLHRSRVAEIGRLASDRAEIVYR